MWTSSNLTIWCLLISSVLIIGIECTRNLTRSEWYRTRRQVACDGFRCRNGECIDEDSKCDGRADCQDGSDETDSCKNLMCRGNIFRCKYGACISRKLECDGKNDCRDGSDETSPKCANVLSSKCKSDEFQCKNKQCINADNKCDGTPHCSDLSDETEEACLKFPCPGYTFKCKYGACISRKGRCNGIFECFDGSDESRETCGDSFITPAVTQATSQTSVTPPTTSSGKPRPPNIFTPGSCILPPKVENGNWSVWPISLYDYQPGDLVMAGTTIEINCRKGHIVSETESQSTLSICAENTGWTITNPKCIQICQPIETSSTTIVTCTNNGVEISCKAPTEGTTARFVCPLFYELSTTFSNIRVCSEGTWDDDRPHCKPVCGQKSVKIKELIIGGQRVKKGFYPWTIALYKRHNETDFSLVCGGSLITERIVITAAHCVTNLQGRKREKELYRVAAGKYYRSYDHVNDTDAEFSEIEEIFVYERYKASTLHYVGDIAILVTKEAFNASQFIQRVCIDWDPYSLYEGRLLNTSGVVTGWGYTVRGGELSEVLKEIYLPYVDYNQCFDATPDEFKAYVREDKMCAGYIDRGVGVCEGDSGGGLAFQRPDNNRFYLRGIVSIAPLVNGSCNEYRYAFYTKISSYIRFISPIVLRYKQKMSDTMWTSSNSTIWCLLISSVLIIGIECTRNFTRSAWYRRQRQLHCDGKIPSLPLILDEGFKCRDGECIDRVFACDGKADCKDGSDETESYCPLLTCANSLFFRCKYGACIRKNLECDGKNDCIDGSDETSPNCVNDVSSKCKSNEFQCKNKQCISADNKCDGTPHCSDLSDETEEACLKFPCPGYTFKCKYGACISRKGRCNGIFECFDGSDESRETCGDSFITPAVTQATSHTLVTPLTTSSGKPRPPNVFTPGSCILPPKIENGHWSIWPISLYDYQPGDLVMVGTTIEINCRKGHVVSETESQSTLSICAENTGWTITNPKCIQICPPIETSSTTTVTCRNNGVEISCKAPTEGTTAKFVCPQFYELSTTFSNIRVCSEGSWDDDIPHCKPVCGQKSVKIKELIIGGQKVKKGFYPWTIALYQRHNETFTHICGGTLITERIVITAAHCVTNLQGQKKEKELFKVAAGKYYRSYDNVNDTDAEFSEIEEIFVYEHYKASTLHYEGDIAIIVTKVAFNASQAIQRICIDWDPYSLYEGRLLNTSGVVTGWGYTVRGAEPSEVLKEIYLPYVDYNQCFDATPDEFKAYVREDKMCAGYIDRGVGVCEGDSGGGLAFQRPDNNRFYLRGIVSTAPLVNGSCNEYRYAFYTKISSYIRFILPIVLRYKVEKVQTENTNNFAKKKPR
ncbi:uncharacterized protein LOC123316036 [Coccinella septempunctata]|uniref:uncharacterized protein LOC123316036 n=1 Tax=Coccinella septempunctata TaxID=41139 RepID=UPI001D06D67E|nr:uncharacterized protein LOC123316036 [Coccinella septempunctata]